VRPSRGADDRSSQAELEVTHHVDSLLGIAIAVLFFLVGVTMNQQAQRSSESEVAVSLLVISMILWLLGVLRRKWPMKLCAWWSLFFLIGTELFYLCRHAIGLGELSAAVVALVWMILAGVSYVILRLVVVEAYLYRLFCACDEATYQQRRKTIEASARRAVVFLIIVVLGSVAWLLTR